MEMQKYLNKRFREVNELIKTLDKEENIKRTLKKINKINNTIS